MQMCGKPTGVVFLSSDNASSVTGLSGVTKIISARTEVPLADRRLEMHR